MKTATWIAFFVSISALIFGVFSAIPNPVVAQKSTPTTSLSLVESISTDDATLASDAARLASPSAEELALIAAKEKEDITKPEEPAEKIAYLALFSKRPIESPTLFNMFAYAVQQAVLLGVPVNTIILILLLPFLATIVIFLHYIIGLPVYNILVPVAFSITLVATGLTAGLVLLGVILLASTLARMLLKKLRIMHMAKLALSLLVVSVFVFGALVIGVTNGAIAVKTLSIFPVLLLILLSERIVAIQLERNRKETIILTSTILGIGIFGYFLLTNKTVQSFILLYPELLLALVFVNVAIGKYFGLRITELFRFRDLLTRYGR
jgi:hypothetical protein